jgi:hypothetical protein
MESKKIDNHWYDTERTDLTRIEAVSIASAWKRNQRFWAKCRHNTGRKFLARALPYKGKYAVFTRTTSSR